MKNRPCTSNGIKLSLHPVNSDLGFNWFFNAKLRIDMKKYIKPTIKTCRLIDTLGYAFSNGGGSVTGPVLNEGDINNNYGTQDGYLE